MLCKYMRILDQNLKVAPKLEKLMELGGSSPEIIRLAEENGVTGLNRWSIDKHRNGSCCCDTSPDKFEKRLRDSFGRELKILIIDLERAKGSFRIENFRGTRTENDKGEIEKIGGLTIEGEFWRLSDWQHIIGYIPWESIIENSRNISFAYAWLGSKEIHFVSEWTHTREEMARILWNALDEADIVVGHNMNGFDKKHMNSELLLSKEFKNLPPSPYKTIDTLQVLRSNFMLDSNKLDAACTFMGLPAKTDHLTEKFIKEAISGNKVYQKRMEEYNKGDIIATTELYLALLPWIKNHPNVASIKGAHKTLCQRCGSENIKREGYYNPSVLVYRRYRCNDCGGSFRQTTEVKGASSKNI